MRKKYSNEPNKSMNCYEIVGLFISDTESKEAATHWAALDRAAAANQINLSRKLGTPTLITTVIPEALRRDARSWLVLYRPDRSQELLVIPYPDAKLLSHLERTGSLDNHAFLTLEEIRGARDRSWYPDNGFSNLSRLKAGTTRRPLVPCLNLNRFQVVSLDEPLEKLLEEQGDSGKTNTQHVLRQASEETRKLRGDLLARLLEESNPIRRDELVHDFEESLVTRNVELSEHATRHVETAATTTLLSTFGDLLDEDSKLFLYSSEAVKQFANLHLSEDFDYSLPASGLWKVVERELNLSLVWFLRIRKGVAGIDSPWDAKLSAKNRVEVETERGSKVNLNRHAESGKLQGLTLGDVRFLMTAAFDNGIHSEVESLGNISPSDFSTFQSVTMPYLLGPARRGMPWQNSLPWLLKEVGNIRNRHAHVDAMQLRVFQELEELILYPINHPWSSHLGKILTVKRYVLKYVSKQLENI